MTHTRRTAEPGVEIEALSLCEPFLGWPVRVWVNGCGADAAGAGLPRRGFPQARAVADWLPSSSARAAVALLTRLAGKLRQARLCLPAPMRRRIPDRGLALVR